MTTVSENASFDRREFSAFIAGKRRAAGMTQEELAKKLFVTHSTVSKWERGLSYPDISLVPAVCRELGISEHEFFSACDDIQTRNEQKQAKSWRRMVWGWQIFFIAGYSVALLTCFICNLAISHRLDWFFIVLASLGLAFSVTTLPVLLKKERLVISMLSASACLLLLLLACGLYTGGGWLWTGFAIVAACLVLPWGLYALWRFYGRHLAPLCLVLLTVWTYGLLAVICLMTGGNWLFTVACPIASLCYAFIWAFFAISYWVPIHPCLKASAFTALTALAIPFGTGLGELVAGPSADGMTFTAYFDWSQGLVTASSEGVLVNRLIFAALLAAALILLVTGLVLAQRRRQRGKSL